MASIAFKIVELQEQQNMGCFEDYMDFKDQVDEAEKARRSRPKRGKKVHPQVVTSRSEKED
ncbi:MAG TPA: hypothetical protein PKK11_02010 [Methanothrix sp.]|nr:hypothetical protein [Methanothrix sp.]HPT19334.1 hypothetical protein [Methanothrix sp.]